MVVAIKCFLYYFTFFGFPTAKIEKIFQSLYDFWIKYAVKHKKIDNLYNFNLYFVLEIEKKCTFVKKNKNASNIRRQSPHCGQQDLP